jgi:hypothetical protein
MSEEKVIRCSDCDDAESGMPRRDFLKRVGAVATAAAGSGLWAGPVRAASKPDSKAETAVKALYETLTDAQKKVMCFDWNYEDPKRGLLRSYVSANWHITEPAIDSDFYTQKQRGLIYEVFQGVFNPEWHKKLVKQLQDDTEGQKWGAAQNIAIFGKPGEKQCEFVMTGRHMTMRADGNSTEHAAFGGPIFHGHAASGYNEKVGHPGNIFWPQAVQANQVAKMLDGKQRETALIAQRPEESDIAFKDRKSKYPGLAVADMSHDQKEVMQKVLSSLIEPYRKEDQDEVAACLKKQGGLDQCHLAFYKEADLGDDGEWDNWRLEGPAFVWYFRGVPHVHIWINVGDDPTVKVNSKV